MDYQNPAIPPLARFALAMVLELPATAVQSAARPPAPLERAAAGRLATLIADDLHRLLPELTRFGLVLPGALYDLTELLRPGWPLLEALESVYRGTLRQGGFQPSLIALGSDSGHFPMPALNPLRRPGAGPLLLLPAVLVGPEDEMSTAAAVLENELLQRGAASAETRQSVQQGFGIEVLNLSYATLGDLCALTKVQLESQELATLWVLLEQALFRPGAALLLTLAEGNRFLYAGDSSFHTPFYTFDDWAGSGPGRDCDAARLAQGYGAWLLRQRQYLMALELHGCTVRQWLGHSWPEGVDADTLGAALDRGAALEGDYLVESVLRQADRSERHLHITHHTLESIGTVAYTVLAVDDAGVAVAMEHHYPLRPAGVNALVERLRQRCEELDLTREVVHPGGLVHAPALRQLRPAGLDAPAATQH